MAENPRGESTFNACEAAHPSQALAAGTGRYCRPLDRRRVVAVCRRVRTAVTRVTRTRVRVTIALQRSGIVKAFESGSTGNRRGDTSLARPFGVWNAENKGRGAGLGSKTRANLVTVQLPSCAVRGVSKATN